MPPGDKVNFNLYNLSGDMLAFLREDTLTVLQQNNILAVLGLTTEGLEGPPGPEGPSAYEVALENGYEGDETSWLATLEGPQGQSSTELFKPYLYNKHLAETVVPTYWQYDGWNYVYGPGISGYEVTIFPDGLETLVIDGDFILPLTQDIYGYDPLPFSLNSIITASGNTADRETIDAILQTIGNCTTILEYPAGFTRILDLAYANFDNGGAFFPEPIQTIIETMLATGWTIDWPFGGAVAAPYIAVGTFPTGTLIDGTYYSQQGGFLYSIYESGWEAVTTVDDMTNIEGILTFPLNTSLYPAYFTKGSDESYYYYTPA
jgi:hypothetical protein